MARKSYRRHRRGGSSSYPAASPSSYSDGASYMMKTVGAGPKQFDNVFMPNGRNGGNVGNTNNAVRGLQGQRAGSKHRGGRYKCRTKKRRGGYWGEVISQAVVPVGLLGMQQSYRRNQRVGTKKNRS